MMRISVFGLGYVGSVTAACLARAGHEVIGVDVNPAKVEAIAAARSPVVEPGLDELVRTVVERGRLVATLDHRAAVHASSLLLVCVGTPGRNQGRIFTGHLERCLRAIAEAVVTKPDPHVVVVRSTVLPGTTRGLVKPLLEAVAGRRVGATLGLCHNPEFMREGAAIQDFEEPSKIIIGAEDEGSAEPLAALYRAIAAPVLRTDFETAEFAKYVDNAWHALKVGFANEIGRLAKRLDIDSHEAMAMLCLDRKLNLSQAYLSPGFAFGGSCLPKDLRALTHAARGLDLDLPILNAVLPSNRLHLELILERVLSYEVRRIGVIGLSFKEGTDDLRESPMVEIIERLVGKGHDVRVFDAWVDPDAMIGENRAFALSRLPHIQRLVAPTLEEVVDHAELLLVGHVDPARLATLAARATHCRILDCARIDAALDDLERYEGICW